jgi:hypothetical protein
MWKRFLALVTSTFFLTGCPKDHSQPAPQKSEGALTAEQFRKLFPLEGTLVDNVLDDYSRVQAALLKHSEHGAQATVSLLSADGSIHQGYDEFFSTDEESTKEVRDNYIAIQVGKTSCVQTAGKMKCRQESALHLGLVDVTKSHVARVWSKDIRCLSTSVPCRFLKIQVTSAESQNNSSEGYSAEPDLVGHEYELVFLLQDYLPLYYKQTDHYRISVSSTAFYTYAFDKPVKPIQLPELDDRIGRD